MSSPIWSPGSQHGRPVDVDFSAIPVDLKSIAFKIPLSGTCWEEREDASFIGDGVEYVKVYQFISDSKYIRRDFTMYKPTPQGREIRESDADLLHTIEYSYTTIANDQIRVFNSTWFRDDLDFRLISSSDGTYLYAPEVAGYDGHREIRLKKINEMPQEKHIPRSTIQSRSSKEMAQNLPSWETEWEVETTLPASGTMRWRCKLFSDGTCSVKRGGREYRGEWEIREFNDFSDMIIVRFTDVSGNTTILKVQACRTRDFGNYVIYNSHNTLFR